MKIILIKLLIALTVLTMVHPQTASAAVSAPNILDELDPFASDIDQQLQDLDKAYFEATGQLPFEALLQITPFDDCKRINCTVYALVKKSEQKLYLYVNQQLQSTWLVSTGLAGAHETPLLDTHPNGRIYDAYSSTKYPGGDYKGLGNMPYAVFIYNGFALHGTTAGNFSKLGKKASHGCVRMHPDQAFIFNRLVRNYGIKNVWVQIVN